jgi:hypothetical protein
MTTANDRPILRLTTPRVRLVWPKLTNPDYGTKDYPKPDGEFSTRAVARLDDPAIQEFLEKLRPFYEQALAWAKEEFMKLKPETRKKLRAVTPNPLYTELLDPVTEQPTGEIEFRFARKASWVSQRGPTAGQRIRSRVALFDARGQVIQKAPEIWSGTIARVSFTATPYFIPGTGAAGLKLGLDAVQILVLRRGGERSAADYGFVPEEDGYAYSEEDVEGEAYGEAPGAYGGATADSSGGDPESPDF